MTNRPQERLGHRLELLALQIEGVLARFNVPAEIRGGAIQAGQVRFEALVKRLIDPEQLKWLEGLLLKTLDVRRLSLRQEAGRLQILLQHKQKHAVDLEDLMDSMPELPAMTAALGLSNDGRPVLLNLLAPDSANILIAGGPEAGKTALLRTFLLSLALKNRQSGLQAVVIAAGDDYHRPVSPKQLYPLNYLPHLLMPVVDNLEGAAEALAFLVEEMTYRKAQAVKRPLIMVALDDVDDLLEAGGQAILRPLVQLLQDGPEAGLQLLLGAADAARPMLRQVLKCNVPLRFLGRVKDYNAAWAAAGAPDSGAEHLLGRGDFVAVANGSTVHFQAAYMADADLHLTLEKLHRQRRPTLVAEPKAMRPDFSATSLHENTPTTFTYDGNAGAISFTTFEGSHPWIVNA